MVSICSSPLTSHPTGIPDFMKGSNVLCQRDISKTPSFMTALAQDFVLQVITLICQLCYLLQIRLSVRQAFLRRVPGLAS